VRILFLTGRFPYPLLRGDQLRAFHQIRILAQRHRVTLASFAERPPTAEEHAAVAAHCERIVTVPLGRAAMAGNLARHALSGLPLQAALYDAPAMGRALRALAAEAEGDYDVAHVQLARMAPHLASCPARARVVDLVDALSLGMERRAARERPPLRWAASLEARRLRAYERRVVAEADGAVVTSAADRDALGAPSNLAVVPNGVDTARFPFGRGPRDSGRVVFTGNLGYFANADAVLWFATRVLPLVRRSLPAVRFEVVGARPPRALRRLARAGAFDLVGPVADVGERLRAAQAAVAPLQAGSGQSNKTLEALASGAPAVITPLAAAGLEARHDEHLLVAESAEEFAAALARVLSDAALAARLAEAGRTLVESAYTWERSVERLEAAYTRAQETPAARARGKEKGRPEKSPDALES
jgi:sugar transferase (PEP-CTERM/EpsH1 system associated)